MNSSDHQDTLHEEKASKTLKFDLLTQLLLFPHLETWLDIGLGMNDLAR